MMTTCLNNSLVIFPDYTYSNTCCLVPGFEHIMLGDLRHWHPSPPCSASERVTRDKKGCVTHVRTGDDDLGSGT